MAKGGVDAISPNLARLALVEEHVRHEIRHDLTAIMGTFGEVAEYADAC